MLSIFIGAFITGTIYPLDKVILACISGGLVAAAANVINDYYDVEIDKINKPHRPIAAGFVTPNEGFIYSLILFLLGIAFSYMINWQAFAVCVFSSVLLFLYSFRLKRTVLWGNISVSLATALAFIYGGIAVSRLSYALIPATFSFFYHLGREIIKDVEDIEGDRADKIKTLPIKYGEITALHIATWIYIFLIVLTVMPYLFNIFGIYYLVMVLFIVDLIVGCVLFSMWRNPESNNLSRLSMILKLNMFAGLLAIYVGKF
ncbi:MAG: geranylgeranylglycerol-phosphate geranylgeranyltransferase [bacterium]|nr:MAG: geranylgeranylglycerol-phosphate geranylgeranyltransferase [bacterium]